MLIKFKHPPSPKRDYAQVKNEYLRGHFAVPLKALERVILLHLFSFPDVFDFDRERLDESLLEGRDAVNTALDGLVSKGYLRRTKTRNGTSKAGKTGMWSWTWEVTIDPKNFPLPDLPDTASPNMEVPSTENQGMDTTSENPAKPQVVPPTENPATEDQSIKEHLFENTEEKTETRSSASASDRPDHLLAKRYYDALDGNCNFMAVRGVIKKALGKYPHDEVERGVLLMCENPNKPFMAQTLWNAMNDPKAAAVVRKAAGRRTRPQELTEDDVYKILGQDYWTVPTPPREIRDGSHEGIARWHMEKRAERHAERQVAAWQKYSRNITEGGRDPYTGRAVDWA
ncbi:hypothetical protein [Amycolatopsis thailandensis]|nr:hypothetical protein [Amycolatopsis thailandensis]